MFNRLLIPLTLQSRVIGSSGPLRVVAGKNDRPKIAVKYKGKVELFSAEEISAMMLMKMKDAVITVPAYFSDFQRWSTKDAGVIASLNVRRIMDEPTTSALVYGFVKFKEYIEPTNVLVFDIGGCSLWWLRSLLEIPWIRGLQYSVTEPIY